MRIVIDLDDLPSARAQHLLFERLFDGMVAGAPRVPLTPGGLSLVEGWRDELLAGGVLQHDYGTWGMLWESVRWSETALDEGPHCGAGVLQFLGHVGEAVQRFGPVAVPLHLALVALFDCQPTPRAVDCVGTEDEPWRLRITPQGAATLGLTGEVVIDEPVPLFDVSQELFEAHFAGTPDVARRAFRMVT